MAQNLRPDLVIQTNKEIIIIDVTVLFDNGLNAFEEARGLKFMKYAQLSQELSSNGISATVEVTVAGALRSWDPANDNTIKKICIRSYDRLMR